MNNHDSDDQSSTSGSVHSYVRSRPQRSARVAFASPDLSPASSVTTSEAEAFVRHRPTSPARPRYISRSRSRYQAPESNRTPAWQDFEHILPRPYRSEYGNYEDIYANDFDTAPTAASDFSSPFLRRSSPNRRRRHTRERDISIDPISNARRWPQYRAYEDLSDDSDDEHVKVHHVINVHPSRSIDNRGNIEQNWLGSRVFTHQSSFNQDEKAFLETYRIVQSRLIPRSEDDLHDRAILTYERNAASSETEIRWVYV